MTARIEMRRDVSGFMFRWNHDIAKRARDEGAWPDLTVAQLAARRVDEHADRIVMIDDGLPLTCRELYDHARHLAGFLGSIGIVPGDVIAFQLPNWWEASAVNLAAALVGAVVNPIVPINRDAELAFMLNAVRAKLVFIPEIFRKHDYAAMLERIGPDLASRPAIVLVRAGQERPGTLDFGAVLRDSTPVAGPAEVDPDALKLVMFTSGTTGRSKGVLHSHNTIHADGMKMQPALGLMAGERSFSPSPVTHVTGYFWALNMPWLGDLPAVTLDVWNPARAFDLLKANDCVFMAGATPFLQGLIEVARIRGETLPALRQYLCGGAAVPPTLIYEAAETFPNCIPWRNFGATEVPTMTRGPESRAALKYGAETDGRLHQVEVKIVDLQSGEEVAMGEEGEILTREASMALGYLDSDDNAAAYDADGFFCMGDLGKIVHGDHILVTGRKKDLIIRGGENISAKEIEDVLIADPAIADAAVVSMPDTRVGEAICAFVVPEQGAVPDMAHVAKLVREAGLAIQKTPERLELVEDFPRTASGKVRKDILREQAAALTAIRDSELLKGAN